LDHPDRRTILLAGAGLAASAGQALTQELEAIPLIETTPHLYDPNRPQGAPYAPNKAGVTAAQLKAAAPKEVRGAIVVESSPWIEDNLWLLEAGEKDPFVVGVVGNLRPEHPELAQFVERFHKHPMYLGIRHGNLWGYDLGKQLSDPAFAAGLKTLGQAGLVLDLANPQLDLLQAAVRASDAAPNLRIVLDHLAGFYPTAEEDSAVDAVLKEIAQRPMIHGKISGFGLGLGDKAPPVTLPANKDRLDRFFTAFGEDRVIGGGFSPPAIALWRAYFAGRPGPAEKFFWRNSARVYRWKPRRADQPRLA
jgi:predicted TIM-barrel fold metal-dependent hydrolase